jgi:hypothetical protein
VKIRPVIFGIFLLSLSASTVPAAERLSFSATLTESTKKILAEESLTGAAAAKADLNGDGMDELILKKGVCPKAPALCTFIPVAETDGRAVKLGEIQARALLLGNGHRNGVRNILAYNSAVNDYEYQLYVWDPARARYTGEEEKSEIP